MVKARQKFLIRVIYYRVSFFLQSSHTQTVFPHLNKQKQQPVKQVLLKPSMADDHLLTKDYYASTAQ